MLFHYSMLESQRTLTSELRTYSLKPSHFPAYMKLSQEKFHLRTAHSKLNGFWVHDLGGLNKVRHLPSALTVIYPQILQTEMRRLL